MSIIIEQNLPAICSFYDDARGKTLSVRLVLLRINHRWLTNRDIHALSWLTHAMTSLFATLLIILDDSSFWGRNDGLFASDPRSVGKQTSKQAFDDTCITK